MLSVSNQEKGQRLARSFPGPCAVVDFGQPLAAITPVWSGQSPHQHMCSSCHLTPVSITGDLHCPGSSSGWGPRGQKVHLPTSSLAQLNHLPWLPGPGRQVKTRARQAMDRTGGAGLALGLSSPQLLPGHQAAQGSGQIRLCQPSQPPSSLDFAGGPSAPGNVCTGKLYRDTRGWLQPMQQAGMAGLGPTQAREPSSSPPL
jgi:hypothetical protein